MSAVRKVISTTSTVRSVNYAKIGQHLDMHLIALYDLYNEYYEFAKGREEWVEERKCLEEGINLIKANNPEIICNYKTILPLIYNKDTKRNTSNIDGDEYDPDTDAPLGPEEGSLNPLDNTPVAVDFTVTNINRNTLFGQGTTFDTYVFNLTDFKAAYSDNNNDEFYSVIIYMSELSQGSLKFLDTPTSGNIFGESSDTIEILRDSLGQWSWYVDSDEPLTTHPIQVQFIDTIGGQRFESNVVTLTIERDPDTLDGNQPATLGDRTVVVDNRAVTTFTLADFTTELEPPYNDPEGDLIDAIRIDEISTDNRGVFTLNGNNIVEGQIIIREDIDAGLFIHTGPDQDAIWGDNFSFSARDEGSQIWVT